MFSKFLFFAKIRSHRILAVKEIVADDCLLWYYRDKDCNEIDMVIECDGKVHPLEIKRSLNPGSELVNAFKILDKGSLPREKGAIICLKQELSAIDSDNFIIPVWTL